MHTCVVVITLPSSAVLILTVLGWLFVQFSNEEESVDVAPPSQITGAISPVEMNSSQTKANSPSQLIARAIFSEITMSSSSTIPRH